MYLGWPSLITHNSVLQYVGPLPATCACSKVHQSLRGLATKGGFKPFYAQSLGPRFWAHILNKIQDSQLPFSLRDGASSVPSSSAGIISSGGNSVYGFALTAAPESVSALLRSLEKQHACKDVTSRFLSIQTRQFLRVLFSLPSPACKFLESRRAARCPWPSCYVFACCSQCPSLFSCFSRYWSCHASWQSFDFLWGFASFVLRCSSRRREKFLSTVRHLSQLARLPSSFFSLTIPRVLRKGKIARLPSSFFSLTSPSDIRTFRQHQGRRERVRWSLMAEFGNSTIHWTQLACRPRYAVLGSRVHPHGHLRVCNRLRSVVGWEDLMAMAVVRRLLLLLSRAFRAHKTGGLFRVCFK